MGDINSIKNILLFAAKNGCKEIHLSSGKLPMLISEDENISYLNGVMALSESLIKDIKDRYISNSENIIITVGDEEFLLMHLGENLVFRHLPYINVPTRVDKSLAAACYSNKGIILITSKEQNYRFLYSYSAASYLVDNRTITLIVVEKNKSFSLKAKSSNIVNVFKPEAELDVLLRITEQINYNCMLVPNCMSSSAMKIVEAISHEKLVIIGTTIEIGKGLDSKNILHFMNVDSDGVISKKLSPELKINTNIIIENLRGHKHA